VGRHVRQPPARPGPLARPRLPARHRVRAGADELPVRRQQRAACGAPPAELVDQVRRRPPVGVDQAPLHRIGPGLLLRYVRPSTRAATAESARVDRRVLRLALSNPAGRRGRPRVVLGEVGRAWSGYGAVVDHAPAEPLVPRGHRVPQDVRPTSTNAVSRVQVRGTTPRPRGHLAGDGVGRRAATAAGFRLTGSFMYSAMNARRSRKYRCIACWTRRPRPAPSGLPARLGPASSSARCSGSGRSTLPEVRRLELGAPGVHLEVGVPRLQVLRHRPEHPRPLAPPERVLLPVEDLVDHVPGSITVHGMTAAIALPGPAMPSTSASTSLQPVGVLGGLGRRLRRLRVVEQHEVGPDHLAGRQRLEAPADPLAGQARRADRTPARRHHAVRPRSGQRLRPVRRRRHGRQDDPVGRPLDQGGLARRTSGPLARLAIPCQAPGRPADLGEVAA
jgi:hypothetical protein